MCELFGFSSPKDRDLTPYLTEFFRHSVTNPNGWGLVDFSHGKPQIQTEPVAANQSRTVAGILRSPFVQKTALAHIRRATIGSVNSKNCHPFYRRDNYGREWLLMHNGTVFNGLPVYAFEGLVEGTTDSERILAHLILQVNAAQQSGEALNSLQRFRLVEAMVSVLSERNKLNLILFDGQLMYVHTNMRGTLYYKEEDGGVVFATVPLDKGPWQEVPLSTLLAYQDGRLTYRGRAHHFEYIDPAINTSSTFDYNI